MKNLILSVALLAAAPLSSFAQDLKIGHLNRQDLMLSLPERTQAETKMQAFAKTLDERLKAMGEEYQAKLQDAGGREATMTNTEKEMVMRELSDLEERIQNAQQKAQEDLAKQEQELLAPMVERTNKAIDAVAKANGFTYILDTSTGFVLYSGGTDVLELVKAELSKPQ
jgi:outer membrane protein